MCASKSLVNIFTLCTQISFFFLLVVVLFLNGGRGCYLLPLNIFFAGSYSYRSITQQPLFNCYQETGATATLICARGDDDDDDDERWGQGGQTRTL